MKRAWAGRWLWLGLVALGVGCGGADSGGTAGEAAPAFSAPASYEQFRAQALRIPGSDLYFVDGDTPLQDERELRDFYDRYVQQGALVINEDNGHMTRWSDGMKTRLTYCVSKAFGARYSTLVQDVDAAAKAWEQVADVHFVHVQAEDANCTSRNEHVLFDVRPAPLGTDPAIYAASFFPNFIRGSRTVWINLRAPWTQAPPTVTGVLRHELGHVLGFRHEHVRPEAGNVCPETHPWHALTDYDPYSVMHYPACNGRGDGFLILTEKDKQGARLVYGPARADALELESDGSADALFDEVQHLRRGSRFDRQP